MGLIPAAAPTAPDSDLALSCKTPVKFLDIVAVVVDPPDVKGRCDPRSHAENENPDGPADFRYFDSPHYVQAVHRMTLYSETVSSLFWLPSTKQTAIKD